MATAQDWAVRIEAGRKRAEAVAADIAAGNGTPEEICRRHGIMTQRGFDQKVTEARQRYLASQAKLLDR